MAPWDARTILLLFIAASNLSAAAQARLVPKQEETNSWGPQPGPHHGYPNGNGHGQYSDGWNDDQYHGWSWPHHGDHQASDGCIRVPSRTPEYACPPVDPDFIGFAFEQASFPRYVQTRDGSINQYTLNMIDAIMSRTGGKPIIRLGGTSADYARYLPSQGAAALPAAEVFTYQCIGCTSIGRSFWDLTKIIPNSMYIIQLPMAHSNVSESVLWAESAAERIGLDRIDTFEPGNEPDLYSDDFDDGNLGPPFYQGTFTNETYTGNFTKYASAVKAALNLPDRSFQAFDTAAHIGDDVLANGYILDVQTNFELGINAGNDVKQVAHHYYQTDGGEYGDLGTGLMQHPSIAARLDLLRKFIKYLHESHPEIPFLISEVGNSLNPTHSYDYQATLGSALWSVDFQLYSMSIGIAKINWQQIMHSGFDMWLPVDSGNASRRTFSNFYAMPFVADFIGKSGQCSTRAAQLETGHNNVVAYAAFVNDKPARIAVVNLDIWDTTDGLPRPSTTFTLSVPPDTRSVTIDVLGSPEGAHASGDSITYGGSQWTAESEGREVEGVRDDSKRLPVHHGMVDIEVHKSEAIILHLM